MCLVHLEMSGESGKIPDKLKSVRIILKMYLNDMESVRMIEKVSE